MRKLAAWIKACLNQLLSPSLYVVEYVQYEGVCTHGVSAFGGCWASGVLPGWDSAFNYWRWLTFEAPDLTTEYRIVRLRYDDDLAINYRFNYKD